jgi:hypothetical protein
VDADRRAQLLGVALRGLVADRTGEVVTESASMGRGVAALVGETAWVLVDERHEASMGPALAWAVRREARALHLLSPHAVGVLTRRAACFDQHQLCVEVWGVQDRRQWPGSPEPLPEVAAPPEPHLAFTPMIDEAGAEVVIEHGVVAGEVAGLEVCRVVTDPHTGAVRLEVGVGAHDREAFTMLHGDVPVADALASVVEHVARHRRVGADPHPLNRLARERLLRSEIMARPSLVGAGVLAPASPPVVRTSLKDPVPCVAVGHDDDGGPVVVVCSSGIDLDVVPFAADARAMFHPAARVVVALESRDDHPVQRQLASMLLPPAHIATVTLDR